MAQASYQNFSGDLKVAVSVTNQLQVFFLSVLGGGAAGIFFDLFRAFRKLVRTKPLWVGVQDILFWLFCTGAAFAFLYCFNDGQPRWYIFCGILLGVLIYHLIARDYVVKGLVAVTHCLGKVLLISAKILLTPFLFLWALIKKPILFIRRPARRLIIFFCRNTRKMSTNVAENVKKIKKRLKMY